MRLLPLVAVQLWKWSALQSLPRARAWGVWPTDVNGRAMIATARIYGIFCILFPVSTYRFAYEIKRFGLLSLSA